MPARLAFRVAIPAATVGLLLTVGLSLQTGASPTPDRVVVTPSAELAAGDDGQLVRAADAVFVGRVETVGTVVMVGTTPYTRFGVTVIDAIKGSLTGQVTVAQLGGAVPARRERVVVSGDTPLQAGRVYLLSVQQSGTVGALVVVPGHGHIDLTADVANVRALTAETARTIPRVAQMRSVMHLRALD
jgi:hypothetical protein